MADPAVIPPEPVNPLTEPLTTIFVNRGKTQTEVQGRVVAPGLAIVPAHQGAPTPGQLRYMLIHIPSGLAVQMDRCGTHVQDVAAAATASGIDWTLGQDDVTAAIKASDLLEQFRGVGYCSDRYCAGDGTPPPTWDVSCDTCYWMWEDEDGAGPLTAQEAKYEAREHRCDPQVTIKDPGTGLWHDPYMVKDDGTIRDLTRKKGGGDQ